MLWILRFQGSEGLDRLVVIQIVHLAETAASGLYEGGLAQVQFGFSGPRRRQRMPVGDCRYWKQGGEG